MPKQHRRSQDRAKGVRQILSGNRRGGTMNWLEHRRFPRMNIATGSHTQPALQSSCEVGDDIAEHVVGDDDVELARVANHLHAKSVNVHVLSGNLWIFGTYFFEDSLPEASRVRHGVGLIAHQNLASRRPVEFGVLLAVFEGVANDALDTFAGVDVLLGSDFVRSSLLKHSPGIGVNALCVFAEDNKIDISRLDAL